MTAIPRALCGSVMAMGRPARPAAEIAAVREAAALVRREARLTSRPAVAREIADRVIVAMLADINRDPDDALAAALAAVEHQMLPSSINTLATCPEIDTVAEYVRQRVEQVSLRCGRYLAVAQQRSEQSKIASEVARKLAQRYLKHLRA